MTIETELPPVSEIRDLFSLPDEYNGWIRYDHSDKDETIFEYWRAESNHVSGRFERLIAKARVFADEIHLGREVFDQFGHRVNYQTLTSRSIEYVDWIWQSATRKMDSHPGKAAFEEPPELPTVIGDWELICDKWDGTENIAVWEWGFGEATLRVTETDIESHYSYTRRPQRIEYIEPDTDPVVIVDDVSRRFAYEIATHILRNLSLPLNQMGDQLAELQSIKGIGPAKSRQLTLLGFTSPVEVAEYVTTESGTTNHKHAEEVDKALTTQIRESVVDRENDDEKTESQHQSEPVTDGESPRGVV